MTIQEKAKHLIEQAQIVTLASITDDGYPRPVVLSKLGSNGFSVFVSTGTSSEKTEQFRANSKAGLSIQVGHDSLTFTGNVSIVTDKSIKQSLWSEWLLEHFPEGVDDPEYTVLQFTPLAVTYWIDKEFVKENL